MTGVHPAGERLLAAVADHFLAHGSWPDSEELQRQLILDDENEDLVVWDEVAHLPSEYVRREPTGDGRELLMLTVQGLAASGRADEELDGVVILTRLFVEAWKAGKTEVPESRFGEVLSVPAPLVDRITTLLHTERWVAHPSRSAEGEIVWRPSRTVFRFRKVESLEDYLEAIDSIGGRPVTLAPPDVEANSPPAPGLEVEELEAALGSEAKNGFVLMPFDGALTWLQDTIRRAGAQEGALMQRADDIFEPGVVLDQITSAIDDADVVISVCTGRNPNVFFEMGHAWRDHNVIMVAAEPIDLPFDVQHYRTELYGGPPPNQDRASLEGRLRRAIASVLAQERLPKARRLTSPPAVRDVVRVTARLESHGRGNDRLVLTNAGTVPVHDVDVSVPEEVRALHLITSDLPLKTLRPGENVPLPAMKAAASGPGVFDLTITARTEDGDPVEDLVTVSLYA